MTRRGSWMFWTEATVLGLEGVEQSSRGTKCIGLGASTSEYE